jgi:hypothetical protein
MSRRRGDKKGDYNQVPLEDVALDEEDPIDLSLERPKPCARLINIMHTLFWMGLAAFSIVNGEVIDTIKYDSRISLCEFSSR